MLATAALIVIKFPQSRCSYELAFGSDQLPPHHNEKLVQDLHELVMVESIQRNYGEPCLVVKVGTNSSPAGQHVLSQILETFRHHGYTPAEVAE